MVGFGKRWREGEQLRPACFGFFCLKSMEVEERVTMDGQKPFDGGTARYYDQS